VAVGRGATVDLSLISGPVTVTAWNRNEVRVRGTSERMPLRFDASGGLVRVWSPRTRSRSSGDQRLDVQVPAGTRVIARSVSGDVRVRGVGGEVEARSTSGDVEAQGGRRAITLQTVSGDVRGAGLEGVVTAQSVSGDVELDDVAGEVGAQTTSGDVLLRRTRLTAGARRNGERRRRVRRPVRPRRPLRLHVALGRHPPRHPGRRGRGPLGAHLQRTIDSAPRSCCAPPRARGQHAPPHGVHAQRRRRAGHRRSFSGTITIARPTP
jgi:hypothetical protein